MTQSMLRYCEFKQENNDHTFVLDIRIALSIIIHCNLVWRNNFIVVSAWIH